MDSRITVLLADDHTIVREGIRTLLETTGKIHVVAGAETGSSAISLARKHLPHVVVTDLAMPGMDGVELTRRLGKLLPDLPVILLTMYASESDIRRALSAGAAGYVVKNSDLRNLMAAIDAVLRGETYLSPSISNLVIRKYIDSGSSHKKEESSELSKREREVLKKIALGWTNREVAHLYSLSEKTVAAHRSSIMRKLNLNTLSHLVRYAVRHGHIDLNAELDQNV